jgi:hypothetical protein
MQYLEVSRQIWNQWKLDYLKECPQLPSSGIIVQEGRNQTGGRNSKEKQRLGGGQETEKTGARRN